MRGHAHVVHIVGVHGIGQGGTSSERLGKEWASALQRGIRGLGTSHPDAPGLIVPHWSLHLDRGAHRLGPGDDLLGASVPMSDEEAAFVAQACADVLEPKELAYADRLPEETLGPPQLWPSFINRLVKTMDRRNPGLGERFVKLIREVRYYLYAPELARRVREHLIPFCAARTSVLLGHSLGSVIAYDLLRRNELPPVERSLTRTLLTCGSPLGIPTVRRALEFVEGEPLEHPAGIRWINVFDRRDLVTGGEGLNQAPAIIDVAVDNGSWDPHGARQYLRTTAVAQAVATAGLR